MREGLWEVAECFAAGTRFFRIQAEMISVSQHLLEQQPRLLEPSPIPLTGASQSLDEPEGADVERAFFARKSVRSISSVVSIYQTARHQTAFVGGRLIASIV